MADGYLENKFNEIHDKRKVVVKRISVDTLLEKNRSYRGYDPQTVVTREMLERIVEVNTKIPSAKNQQVLRFKLITREDEATEVMENIKLGGMLPELHLPFPGTEPQAFIIVCATVPETKMVDIDLGISAQSMLLKAVEMNLNGIIIGAFNKQKISELFQLPYEPLLILAIGKGNELIRLTPISEGESKAYYRKNGIHFVPKIKLKDLIV
ncbi:MAG: nitroreductase family protein [Bacteroidales bacterium]|nr:nitroreductase family protein [Bacteroidales bacterium]